jgi:hypothetical protein
MTDFTVLFCRDPLTSSRVDGHFAWQANTVRDLDGQVALIDHDLLMAGDPSAAVRKVPRDLGPAWFRGWMIPPAGYAALAEALAERGVPLQVTPDQYRRAHELPGWYDIFAPVTPLTAYLPWEPSAAVAQEDLEPLADALGPGPGMVKDYTKSRKHEWREACFIPDLRDLYTTTQVVNRMIELQAESLAGGIVLRRFERYEKVAGRTIEARVWWLDGVPIHVGAHPDTPAQIPEPDLTDIAPLVEQLDCRYVTTDIALREDGAWRVIEVGDAQVSDLPSSDDPRAILAPLSGRATGNAQAFRGVLSAAGKGD